MTLLNLKEYATIFDVTEELKKYVQKVTEVKSHWYPDPLSEEAMVLFDENRRALSDFVDWL